MAGRNIKVLIVDDSLLFRETLAKEISKDLGIEVIGTAEDPYVAVEIINRMQPDVITLDVEMPKMNGIDFLKKLLPQYPVPVVVVSSVAENVFDALDAGAVDFVTKPNFSRGGMPTFINELIVKIKIASMAKVTGPVKTGVAVPGHSMAIKGQSAAANVDRKKLIAIGASTGGTEALYELLTALPADVPGILIVQHMPIGFTKLFAERLDKNCKFRVKEAENGDEVIPGRAIVAAGDSHMRLLSDPKGYKIKSAPGEKVSGHCPSVDALFESVAAVADNKKVVGVILTGMGRDGAAGMVKMRQKGAYTIGQDEKSCIVYGMPKVAYDLGGVVKQLPLSEIAAEIMRHV